MPTKKDAPTGTVTEVEYPEVILAEPSDEYEYKGDVPDPGEGLPLEEHAPPAEVPDPPGIQNPYVVTAHVGDRVVATKAFIQAEVWNHLSPDDYDEYLKELSKELKKPEPKSDSA